MEAIAGVILGWILGSMFGWALAEKVSACRREAKLQQSLNNIWSQIKVKIESKPKAVNQHVH